MEGEIAEIEGRAVSVVDEVDDMDDIVQVEDGDEEFAVAVDDGADRGDDVDFEDVDGVEFDL